MKSLIKYGKALLFNILSLFLILFLFTLLYYFDCIDDKTYQLFKLITLFVTIFIQSFSLGKMRKNKRYLEGVIYGSLFILILLSSSILTNHFQIKSILYYFMILCTSVLGSMFGLSKEKK